MFKNRQRKVIWAVDVNAIDQESRLFSTFDRDLLDKMANRRLTLHFHKYGISLDDFDKYELGKFYKVTQYDQKNGALYPIAYEAYDYPIYGTLYHPEYQNANFTSKRTFNVVKNTYT